LFLQAGPGGRVPISRVTHDLGLVLAAGVLFEQLAGSLPVGGIGRGGGHLVDQLGVRVHRQVRLVPVEAPA